MPAGPSRCCSHALTLLRCYINSAYLQAFSPDAPIVSTGVRLGRAVSLRDAGCGTGKQKREHQRRRDGAQAQVFWRL
jgi:hypothetical protein